MNLSVAFQLFLEPTCWGGVCAGRESSMDALAGVDFSTLDEDSLRKIDYRFESDVLSLPRIVTRLKFSVGDNIVEVGICYI